MAETRSQRQRGQRASVRATSGRGRGRGRGATQALQTTTAHIQGNSGAMYTTTNLSPNATARATQGLTTGDLFEVDTLRHFPDRGYYAFQLKKPVGVRLHNPASGRNLVECSCEDRDDPEGCIHIYWLLDALRAALGIRSPQRLRSLTLNDVYQQISGLYDQITERETFLKALLNGYRQSDESDEEEDRKAFLDQVLSIFDHAGLPEEYLENMPEDQETDYRTPLDEVLIADDDPDANLLTMAVRHESIAQILRSVSRRDLCARYFLKKQRSRARKAIQDLDNFAMDVKTCSQMLRSIVQEISDDLDTRMSVGPLAPETRRQAAEDLVEMIEQVTKRDQDVGGANLYADLIALRPGSEKAFILGDLQDLGRDSYSHLIDRLYSIIEDIKDMAPNRLHPSVKYAERINEMLDGSGSTNTFPEPSSLSAGRQRRPTLPDEHPSQRPRLYE